MGGSEERAMQATFSLEDIATAVYCAVSDALTEAGYRCEGNKVISRRGPPPDVDDREVLCLALLQELLGFDSDNAFHLWMDQHAVMRSLFPRRLSRQKFADRRVQLTPVLQRLTQALCDLNGEGDPPFVSSIPTRWTSAASNAHRRTTG